MDTLRVGMVHLDLHAYYYAALVGGYDPLALRDDPLKVGQSAFFYHYLHYSDPRQMTSPLVPGFELVRFWDEDRRQAENMARIFNPQRGVACATVDEVSDGVDVVFIADCNGDGSQHLAWARPGLLKGVPTFVDKPFAADYADARELVALAERSGAPLLSMSILGQTPQVFQFRNRLVEVGDVEFGTVKGGGTSLAGQIHAIALAVTVFGDGVAAVESMGPSPLAHMLLDYGGKEGRPPQGVMLNCDVGATWHCAMYASAYGRLGAIHSPPIGDFEFPGGAAAILGLVRELVQARRSPVPTAFMLETVAVATAARRAHQQRRRVALAEVCA
jgi:predicted dehydrogenase